MPAIFTAISYKSIFDDYDVITPKDLLRGIPTITALKYISYISAQLHINETNWEIHIKLFELWSINFPKELKKRISNKISKIQNPSIFNNITSLFTIEAILENERNKDDRKLTPEEELSLFKLYLWESQKWTDEQKVPSSISCLDEYVAFSLPLMLPFIEFFKYKDFRTQIIKAIYFFQFCEKNQDFSKYLELFLQEYNLTSWQDYLLNLISLYIRPIQDMKTPSTLIFEDSHRLVIDFLEHFCLDLDTYTREVDFKGLRNTPVLKIKEKEYLFLNLNFLIDKLFQGIQFDFFRVIQKNKATYNGKIISSFPNFKSIYGQLVSETGILYRTLNNCFGNSSYILRTGDEMKTLAGDGYSDFYIRDKKKIFLFEYKDVWLSYPTKSSNNINTIIQELKIKFVRDQRGSDEGVTQLVNNIANYRQGKYNEIDKYQFEDTIIYPILIYSDEAFSTPGFNYLIRKEFKEKIREKGLENDLYIKDVIMIHLDTFVLYQNLFKKKVLKLNHCLNNYIATYYGIGDIPSKQINGLESFSLNFLNEIQKLKNVSFDDLNSEVHSLVSSFL